MEHVPGIHGVPGVRGGNVYLLTEGPLTLIDAGIVGDGSAILRHIESLGFGAWDLARILLTHRHADHAGGAAALREATGAAVYAHTADLERRDDSFVLRGRLRTGRPTPVDCPLEDGQELEPGIVVVHSGGHTSGSVAFYLPAKRALFLGDTVINNVSRLSRPLPMSNEDSAASEVTLRRLAALDADAGFFGHGPPLLSGLQEALVEVSRRSPGPVWLRTLRHYLGHPLRSLRRD